MRLTVEQVMKRVASTVNQEAIAPAAGTSEALLWVEFLNRGVQEWAMANDWDVLRKNFFPSVSGATVPLPLDYKKLSAPPVLHGATESEDKYLGGIIEDERGEQTVSSQFFEERGDISGGYFLNFHPATLLTSGASLDIPYYSLPTSLTSYTQVPLVNDADFLVDRTIAYVFEARSDPRFQQQEAKARDKLLSMVEDSNDVKFNSYARKQAVRTKEQKLGFRLGRD